MDSLLIAVDIVAYIFVIATCMALALTQLNPAMILPQNALRVLQLGPLLTLAALLLTVKFWTDDHDASLGDLPGRILPLALVLIVGAVAFLALRRITEKRRSK